MTTESTLFAVLTTALADEAPLRVSLPAGEQLRQLARTLAQGAVTRFASSPPLYRRLSENARILTQTRHRLAEVVRRGEPLASDGEWLLDNFYILEDVIREVQQDLPRRYYSQLPIRADGPLTNWPRVYELAVALLAHSDANLDESRISDFVRAYQEMTQLTIGELWAVPTMLRLGLLENLRRLAIQALQTLDDRANAEDWARSQHNTPLPEQPRDAFLVALQQVLRDRAGADHVLLEWLQRHIPNAADALRREHRRQAANQVSVGNSVTSLRLLQVIEWPTFFEKLSVVEAVLRSDRSGAYALQDFATRDRCRQAIERIARRSQLPESLVARRALETAANGTDERSRHVAHPLLAEGRWEFERVLEYRPTLADCCGRALRRYPHVFYFGSLGSLMLALVAGVVWLSGATGWLAVLVALLALLPVSAVAVALTNFLACKIVAPKPLPRLDFKKGIAADCSTLVVIPCLLSKPESAKGLLERLERHFLANSDPQLSFALLTDLTDAPQEHMPSDDACVAAAVEGVRRLNEKHAQPGSPRFYLLHRRRLFNPSENCWMGHERKRGKLDELNRLLLGDGKTSFRVISDPLPKGRFVLTLDADTVLPREAARHLIAALAHPLNRPILSADGRIVTAGFGVLQPRVSFLYRSGLQSWFAKIFAGSAGLDPYVRAISDVYQDLFGRGSFTGKGLYDVAAFAATAGRAFPDNHILSHDLIESAHARCALVSDVEVFDDFPPRYHAYARREHRWVRGDWQLLPWLLPRVPTPAGTPAPNVLPSLERWKVIDNLRRSLVPLGLLAFLVLGWTVLPGSPLLWTLLGILVAFISVPLSLWDNLVALLQGTPWRAVVGQVRQSGLATAGQAALFLAFLPHHALGNLDAIVRTLWRKCISKRRLLEWEPAAAAEQRLSGDLRSFVLAMWPASIVSLGLTALLAWLVPESLPAAGTVLVAWVLSPVIAWRVSQPRHLARRELRPSDRRAYRRIARKTWAFFEDMVGPADHWLPPDNFQEVPGPKLARRTSPTNMGLLLLSTLTAHDLGYITLPELCRRLRETLDTFARLERHRGHFFNWYDTATLQPLQPQYVSTVDSGNLLGCLWVVALGLEELAAEPVASARAMDGLCDTLELLGEELRTSQSDSTQVLEAIAALEAGVDVQDRTRQLLSLSVLNGTSSRWAARVRDLASARLTETTELADPSRCKSELAQLVQRCEAFGAEMDFRFLYDEERHLFAIGYNASQNRPDSGRYDLLASEASLTSYLAIARGEVPVQHWFQLGRLATVVANRPGLVSWGGTMFEYLMPRLLLVPPPGTLLAEAQIAAVAQQIEWSEERSIPWGVSESAFYYLDRAGDYQYRSFGVPGLGLKRGLERDMVIAPYATLLAAPIAPRLALLNLEHLQMEGGEGPLGFYEAIDYSEERLPRGVRREVVRSYMAHHQGMALVAVGNLLTDDAVPRRLRRDPRCRAAELLLEERVPLDAPEVVTQGEETTHAQPEAMEETTSRRLTTPETTSPRVHLLTNGRYSVLVTNSGAGFSTCRGLDVTRWRSGPELDEGGTFIYVRDLDSGKFWSCGHAPVRQPPEAYEVIFSIDKAELRRLDQGIETFLEIAVHSEQDAEVRRVTLTNLSERPRRLELTSYVEVVLLPHAADRAHPAFGKLFLETFWVPQNQVLLCRRRPRSEEQASVWAVHCLSDCPGGQVQAAYETDRRQFLGRRHTLAAPHMLRDRTAQLSSTVGPVLDPSLCLRHEVTLEPGEQACVTFATGVAVGQNEALALADELRSPEAVNRVFELAWARSRLEVAHRRLTVGEVHLFHRLLGHVLSPVPALRASAAVLQANRQGQSALWRHGISGDWPILVLRLTDATGLPLLRQLIQAQGRWRDGLVMVDLLVLIEDADGYFEGLYQSALETVHTEGVGEWLDRVGGIFLRKGSHISEEDLTLLLAMGRVVLESDRGLLAKQIDLMDRPPLLPPALRSRQPAEPATAFAPEALRFFNGTGGFSPDGSEYVIAANGKTPPAPWVNVISNSHFGFLISDSGSGFTWAGNSQMNRLTRWSNDPVSDPSSEALYLRDEVSGASWSVTPLPALEPEATECRHGAGYTVFRQRRGTLASELTLFVAADEPVKLWLLTVTNQGKTSRRLSATLFIDWVLGSSRELSAPHTITSEDEDGALLAHNVNSADYPNQVAFLDVSERPRTLTGDRNEFIGRHGSLAVPAALGRVALSGRTGAGLSPCGAVMAQRELPAGGEVSFVFVLGQASRVEDARALAARYRSESTARSALEEVRARWNRLLSTVQVATPDEAMDLLVNRWLLYQVLSCRVWGRSAFYQSGGAYGFRDQLQDVCALVHAAPGEARNQLLRAAAHQFLEGDVQHWWHPPSGKGVRTRFSDDFLWLPLATQRYVHVTGDLGVLEEQVPYLRGPHLAEGQEDLYGQFTRSEQVESLYDHCVRALDHGWQLGSHGLPLMGAGDWNDGMNRVGIHGKGESVWLAWFQAVCLTHFAELAEQRRDSANAQKFRTRAEQLKAAAEAQAWDGEWYRRAYFDDGTPLGTATGEECRIDSLPQSWAVLAGADPERAERGMRAVLEQLVKADEGLILLFTPAFAEGNLRPGYIKGYVPGIRENGGQYTHAAAWVILALLEQGQGTQAGRLLQMIDPIRHTETAVGVERYRVEPYVLAGDVYGLPPHTGRGGWTWYTGAAGWLYRAVVEHMVGLQRQGERLRVWPCIPAAWREFQVRYRHGATVYVVRVTNPEGVERGVRRMTCDGVEVTEVQLRDDGHEHRVEVVMGA